MFIGVGGSFDYPSAWSLSQFPDDASSFSTLLAVISSQPVHDPCVHDPNDIICNQPLDFFDSGGVFIRWSEQSGRGIVFAKPSGSPSMIDGKKSIITTNPAADLPVRGHSQQRLRTRRLHPAVTWQRLGDDGMPCRTDRSANTPHHHRHVAQPSVRRRLDADKVTNGQRHLGQF